VARNPIIWFEIYVQDMPRAKAFYESVFQVKLEKLDSTEFEMWGFPMEMHGMGCQRCLGQDKGVASGGNSTLVYFSCKDCAVEADRVIQCGGSLDRKKNAHRSIRLYRAGCGYGGNMIGLHSMK